MKMDERIINMTKLAKHHNMTPDELAQTSWYDYHLLLEEALRDNSKASAPAGDW